MKIKLLILGLGLGASILAGCNDDFSSIGTSIQPGDDTIAVYMDTFQIQARDIVIYGQLKKKSHYGAIRFYLRKVY